MKESQNKKILILGGTRFFGKALVEYLQKENYRVFSASNKGENSETHFKIDRNNINDLEALAMHDFDVIIDQICYNPLSAIRLCNAFKNRCQKLIYISTADVYSLSVQYKKSYSESSFLPKFSIDILQDENWNNIEYNQKNYVLGKRLAEEIYLHHQYFSDKTIVLRLANVVSLINDPTNRFKKLLNCVLESRNVEPSNIQASFIHFLEVKEILKAIIDKGDLSGIFNLSTIDEVSVNDLYSFISNNLYENILKREPETYPPDSTMIISPLSCNVVSEKLFNIIKYPKGFYTNLLKEINLIKNDSKKAFSTFSA